MKVLVVFLVFAASAAAVSGAATSCAPSEDFFSRHNISADDRNIPGSVCGGQCCGRGRETQLRNVLRRRAEQRVATALRPITELLLATKRTLQEHLTALSYQSQNKTAIFFTQLYKSHAIRAQAPLAALYDDIRILLKSNSDEDNGDELGTPSPKDLTISANKFFREVFPIAYQNVLKLDMKQFTPEYEACLKDAYDAVQPFGDVPQQLGVSLSQSLEAARALLQVLVVGAGALSTTERVLSSSNEECSTKLLRMGGCSRCKGFDTSPCRNYCLNVARGCIGSLVVELDAPWAGYVEGVERVARPDADAALRALDSKVSSAIMHALENHVILEKKVRQECGPPSTLDVPNPASSWSTPGATRRDSLRAPPPDTELLQFAATLAASKKLFASISDRLCDQPDFANENNEQCWNGETIGEYTKALVASASLSDQKYNPEITASTHQDFRVAALGDRLRQARQLLVSHSWGGSAPAAEAFMQGDEAGDEGSGSGRSYSEDDAAYDAEGSGEEGSGIEEESIKESEETTHSSTPNISSAARFSPLVSVIISFATYQCLHYLNQFRPIKCISGIL
ncbi:division abnormally delayed protein isoform X2 [Maniola jurtina]|uniref:division abnormally delayed protein isoform X2 n=1 Tax=Maniola jurtina TaxID=191418 RepID=UPI001E68AB3D|nr:division abnormally delayed protein isoform X2 [Maniola jurtina]